MQRSPGNKQKQHSIQYNCSNDDSHSETALSELKFTINRPTNIIIILKLIASKINIPNFMALYMIAE